MRYHRGGVLDLCVLHEELDSKGTDHWPDGGGLWSDVCHGYYASITTGATSNYK